MRSINTTVMGVLPVLAMLIVGKVLGAETLLEFAVALLVGLVVGAYSSIFVAAPILAHLKEREPRYRAVRERVARGGPAVGDDLVVPIVAGGPGAPPPRPVPRRNPAGPPWALSRLGPARRSAGSLRT
jgi:preprotein translocase subunit SecF